MLDPLQPLLRNGRFANYFQSQSEDLSVTNQVHNKHSEADTPRARCHFDHTPLKCNH